MERKLPLHKGGGRYQQERGRGQLACYEESLVFNACQCKRVTPILSQSEEESKSSSSTTSIPEEKGVETSNPN